MPEFTVFLTARAELGVRVTADTAAQAEEIAEHDHFGPDHTNGIAFGTWDVATGLTEPYGTPVRNVIADLHDVQACEHCGKRGHLDSDSLCATGCTQ